MNPNLNRQPGVTGSPAVAVEAAKPLAGTEKKSVMARISSVSSGIFGKIKSVMPFVNSAEVAAPVPVVPNIPNYKPITPADLAPKNTMVYRPPMAIPRRGEVAGVAAKRSAPDLSKDLFAHLSEKPADDSSASAKTEGQTLTLNGLTSAKLSVYPAGSMPKARVIPRNAPAVDYKFEYQEPAEESRANNFAPNLSNVFKRNAVLSATEAVKPAVATATIQPKRKVMSALEDVNNYVAEQDRQYYADLEARRSRGVVKNLGLWATRIKEDVISAVAPNYVMRKAYEAAQTQAVTPVAQPAVVSSSVQAKPSFFSRLKAGYENAKATLFPKARKLVTAAALAGAAMGLNASEQGTSIPAGAQKSAAAYTAKADAKTEAQPVATKSIPTVKSVPVVSPSAKRAAVNGKQDPSARPARLSNELAAINAPSLSSTVSDSPSAGIGKATERVLTPDPLADITDSINNAYFSGTGFHNGIYRGYHGHNDGSVTVSRTSLCSR